MESKFLDYLRDPIGQDDLDFHQFEAEEEQIISAVFVNPKTKAAYPIVGGVPIMLPNSFPKEFLDKFSSELAEVNEKYGGNLRFQKSDLSWSFSAEWEHHFNTELSKTWGYSVQERYDQFLLNIQSSKEELQGKFVLDGGCGNGDLTKEFAINDSIAFGVDYSESVLFAEKHRDNKNTCFVRADLRFLPFRKDLFDVIVANGVIHHTPSTEKTFHAIAPFVKKEGKYYVWLYSEKGNFGWRVKRKFFDFSRIIVCRLPEKMQDWIVSLYVSILKLIYPKSNKDRMKIAMYDSITPRWRYYHTPEEVAHWYHQAGFGPVVLTHFDNVYGFGVYAPKIPQEQTPGNHFGEKVNYHMNEA